ncbi:MAG TPA: hypothetical protein VIG36_05920 [Methylocystis sp.]
MTFELNVMQKRRIDGMFPVWRNNFRVSGAPLEGGDEGLKFLFVIWDEIGLIKLEIFGVARHRGAQRLLSLPRQERHAPSVPGATVALCKIAIEYFRLATPSLLPVERRHQIPRVLICGL